MSSASCVIAATVPERLRLQELLANRRLLNFLAALFAAALMGYALYAQHGLGLEPCPLCMFQRVGISAVGVVFLLAALHHPASGFGSRAYGLLIAVTAAGAAYIAGRHVWIQTQPAGSVPACGAPLDMMLDMFPLLEVVRKVLTGGGECGKIDWLFLGVTMPGWVLIAAVSLGLFGLVNNFVNAGPRAANR
ncbi:MAG: disulfide bond formation protein B [Proteobacteria bacterium]|nr:disulfide bond formation protein B [Pseudomonadota bacterium]